MKRMIKASKKNVKLLAKGIIILPKYTYSFNEDVISVLDNIQFIRRIEQGSSVIAYVGFTEAEYDVTTHRIDGELLNHDSLLSRIDLPDTVENNVRITTFSVDLNAHHTDTELVFGRGERYMSDSIVEYLRKLFKVGKNFSRDVHAELQWLPTSSPEFKQRFIASVQKATKIKHDLFVRQNGGSTESDVYPVFAMCVAVIDDKNDEGIVADGSSFLIVADTYREYKKEVRKLTNELGYENENELLFKTVFTGNVQPTGDWSDVNSTKGNRNCVRKLITAILDEDRSYPVKFNNIESAAVVTKVIDKRKYNIQIRVSPTVLDPQFTYGYSNRNDNAAAEIMLPTFNGEESPYSGSELISMIDEVLKELIIRTREHES